jgi:hypothetical protein
MKPRDRCANLSQSKWQRVDPPEPLWKRQRRAPSLEDAQLLLNLARGSPGTTAWLCVDLLGKCHIYSPKPLWTAEGPTAAGLLRDPVFKLLNLLHKSRLRDGKGLDSVPLCREVVRCKRIWENLDDDVRMKLSVFGFVSRTPASRKAWGVADC